MFNNSVVDKIKSQIVIVAESLYG